MSAQFQKEQPKEIAANILKILSKHAYSNFAQALKEIINNAFDAGAQNVNVRTLNDYNDILITDDGSGMTNEEFRDEYTRIAGPSKREGLPVGDKRNRPIIGMLGIGALAIAPVCEKVKVLSWRGKGHKKFEAVLDYAEYLKDEHKAKPLSEVYQYIVQTAEWSPKEAEKTPFTYITLVNISPAIREALKKSGNSLQDTVDSSQDLSGIDYLRWSLGLLVPVKYKHREGPTSEKPGRILKHLIDRLEGYDFRLFVDDVEVFKPIYFPSYGQRSVGGWKYGKDWAIYTFKESLLNAGLTFSGYIVNQRSMIVPRELQGILIRIKDVGVGQFRKDIVGPRHSSGVFPTTISGEVCVDAGLEEALTFDRAGFRESDPHYQALTNWLENKVRTIKSNFWERGRVRSEGKREERTASVQQKIISTIGGYLGGPYSQKKFKIKEIRTKDVACQINPGNGLISINHQHPIFGSVVQREREIVQIFLYALEIARERSGRDIGKMYDETIRIAADLLERRAKTTQI